MFNTGGVIDTQAPSRAAGVRGDGYGSSREQSGTT